MSDERLALPGFEKPASPKAAERVFANPDGSVELVIRDNVPLDVPMPDYHVLLSTEYGSLIQVQAHARTGHVVTKFNTNESSKQFVLRLGEPCMKLTPATYTVRALVDGKEVFFKNLTVLPHPELTRTTDPNLFPAPDGTT